MALVKIVKPRVSYSDLERMPEDGRRYELYDGEVFVVPSPLPIHQFVAQNIANALQAYAASHGGLCIVSPIDIVFSEFTVLQPDVVFFRAERRHLVNPRAVIRSSPDLVVEVLSPSTADTDRGKKMQMFVRYQVPEYWIVDPVDEHLEAHVLTGGAYMLAGSFSGADDVRSSVLDGFSCETSRLFRIP